MTLLSLLLFSFLSLGHAKEPLKSPPKASQTKTLSWVAHLMRQKEGSKIPGLNIYINRLPVVLTPSNGDLRPLVEVPLQYENPGWDLYTANGKKVAKKPKSNVYAVYAFLNSQVNDLELFAKNEAGEKVTEKIYIFAPQVQEFAVVSPWRALYATVGLAAFSYEQTRFGVLAYKGASLGIGYDSRENASAFDYHFYTRMTVLSFQTQPVAANPQYINGHATVSYRLPTKGASRWRTYGGLGLGYLNLNSFGSSFGFSGLFAPILSFRAKQFLTTKSTFFYDFKTTLLGSFDFNKSRGFELGWTWSKILKSSRRQDISILYDNTRFVSSGQQIGMEYFSIRLGYSL